MNCVSYGSLTLVNSPPKVSIEQKNIPFANSCIPRKIKAIVQAEWTSAMFALTILTAEVQPFPPTPTITKENLRIHHINVRFTINFRTKATLFDLILFATVPITPNWKHLPICQIQFLYVNNVFCGMRY